MSQKTYAGVVLELNDEGYMLEKDQWTKEIGKAIAQEENIELTDKHFEVIEFLRDRVAKGEGLTIRSIGKSGIVDIKGFYALFPGAPLKLATRIGGLPKPVSCV
jgi:dissimilatory sulfite reductase related protein